MVPAFLSWCLNFRSQPRGWAYRHTSHCSIGASFLLLAECALNTTRGRSAICEIHHVSMAKMTVPTLDRVMTRKWREDADSELLRAKRDVK